MPTSWIARRRPVAATAARPKPAQREKRRTAMVLSSATDPRTDRNSAASHHPAPDRKDVDPLGDDLQNGQVPGRRVAGDDVGEHTGGRGDSGEGKRESADRCTSSDQHGDDRS